MNYSKAQEYLQKIRENGTKLSLENIKTIIDNLPFSLSKIKFIQVAGTNGKGSTSHFITSILKSNGYKVGLFTSPHLQNVRERITINKSWITEIEFANEITKIKDFISTLISKNIINDSPTFFEHLLLLGLFHFYYNSTDFVVLEVGLGGRLDATSAITPIVSVITNISLEHTKTLGKTISEIAFEKAGIAKKNIPLINASNKYSIASKVIESVCIDKGALYYQAFNKSNILSTKNENNYFDCSYKTESDIYNYKVYMNGIHQTRNASTAIKALEVIKPHLHLSKKNIAKGIEENFVPGRIELIKGDPEIIIDAGHNVEGIKVLSDFLNMKKYNNNTLIFGVLRDKKFKIMISLLEPFMNNIILLEPKSNRALPIEKLELLFKDKNVSQYKDNYTDALNYAKSLKNRIIITGSIYMIGEMRNIIKPI